MNDRDFKLTLAKALERKYLKNKSTIEIDFIDIYTTIPSCGLYFEYTGIFTRTEWNTYCAILHLQVPISKIDCFEKYHKFILDEAIQIFGKQDDYYLTDLNVDTLIQHYQSIDFSVLGLNETLKQAIGDATILMEQGHYGSSVDRIHTALHGYLRIQLDQLKIEYEESDMMPKLFNILYKEWEKLEVEEVDEMMLKALRSASSTLNSLNDIRNKYSLAHPNKQIIGEPEAILVLGLTKYISEYMNTRKLSR